MEDFRFSGSVRLSPCRSRADVTKASRPSPTRECDNLFYRNPPAGSVHSTPLKSSGTKFGKASIFWPSISSPKPLLSTREDGFLAETARKRSKFELCLCKTRIPGETLHRSPIRSLPLSTVPLHALIAGKADVLGEDRLRQTQKKRADLSSQRTLPKTPILQARKTQTIRPGSLTMAHKPNRSLGAMRASRARTLQI